MGDSICPSGATKGVLTCPDDPGTTKALLFEVFVAPAPGIDPRIESIVNAPIPILFRLPNLDFLVVAGCGLFVFLCTAGVLCTS